MMTETSNEITNLSRRSRWYERFFPFIAKGPEMQLAWLDGVFGKGILSYQEICPYIRLMLVDEGTESQDELRGLFAGVNDRFIEQLLSAANIYDIPKLLRLIHHLTPNQAVIALRKEPPPYEKSPQLLLGGVFQTINDCSSALLEQAALIIRASDDPPGHFEQAYERFQEVLKDQTLLSELYPKARG